MLVGQSVDPPFWSLVKYLDEIAIKFYTDVHGPQRMKPYYFCDPLIISLVSP